jgi:hypothetical protein
MRFVAFFSALSVAAVSSGCAIHPLPEDVASPRNTTYYIVQKIRCEAKDAVRASAVDPLQQAALDKILARLVPGKPASPADITAIAATLRPGLRDLVLGYNFTFTISEGDGSSGAASFAFPFSNGSFALSLGLGEDKERKAERTFIITETASELLGDTEITDCADSENWKYPITGIIGLNEVVDTYVKLSGLGKGPTPNSRFYRTNKDLGNFVDTLSFTTSYNGSVQPRLTLNPVRNDFRLTSASANLGATRKDVHKVAIVLTSIGLGTSPGGARAFGAEGLGRGDEAGRAAAQNILLREQTKGILNDILENVEQ